MQYDVPNANLREAYLHGAVAVVITIGLFLLVPAIRNAPPSGRVLAAGMVPIRILSGAEEAVQNSAPEQAIAVHVAVRTKQTNGKGVRQAPPRVVSGEVGGTSADSTQDEAHYEDELYKHIAKFIRYPRAALGVCPSGTAYVRFQSGRQGQLLSIVVEQSSGCTVIDAEAVETVRRAQPLPPVPSNLPERMTVHMPLSFGKG